MSDIVFLLILSLVGSVLALVGGAGFLYIRSWNVWLSKYSVSFAAGVLLTVALTGLLPEASHIAGEGVYVTVLLSFLGAFLFEQFFFGIHHHEEGHHDEIKKSSVSLIIVGDTVHNFIDGVAIAAAFLTAPGLGVVTAISTFLHEVPHEIGDFGILLKASWRRGRIILVNLLSALATLVGTFMVLFLTPPSAVIGNLLAVSAGIFLYLGASDFLPHLGKHGAGRLVSVLTLLTGVAVMLVTFYAIPHTH